MIKRTLFNCSKEEIKGYIKYLQKTSVNKWVYAQLEDVHTKDPWIKTTTLYKPGTVFAIAYIATSVKESKELGILPDLLIYRNGQEEQTDLDALTEELYNYIVKTYQK